jgi:N6-L-threonylcarbamoyladenine synthase
MKVLGIETSCDETAAAVVENGRTILSSVINSQIDIHQAYGGVVPEVAARSHIEVINPVINQALTDANLTWDDIDAIAVTYAPGLVGSLLIGTLAARTLAIFKNKPLYPIHHIQAHVYANFLNDQAPKFPILALIVSGGHSQIMLFESHTDYKILGQTCDDAVGEAFDKVAKIIGLPYPGGPSIAKAATNGDQNAYKLPKAKVAGKYDFSFSGLKTAVLRAVQHEAGVDINFPSKDLAGLLSDTQRANFAASFQKTAIETLVDKAQQAFQDYSPESVVIAGGVAANTELRRVLSERLQIEISYPPIELCTDNAAMVACLGYYQSQITQPVGPFSVEVLPSLSL